MNPSQRVSRRTVALAPIAAVVGRTGMRRFASANRFPDRSAFGVTHIAADGNRFVGGMGTIPGTDPVDIDLPASPRWLVAARDGAGLLWAAVLANGAITAFRSIGRKVEPFDLAIAGERTSSDAPPLLKALGNDSAIIGAPEGVASSAHSAPAPTDAGYAIVDEDGDLVFWSDFADDQNPWRSDVDALPDARIVIGSHGLLALYTGRTEERYAHGVLGDEIEGTSLTIVDPVTVRTTTIVDLPSPDVFEGVAPMWIDIDDSGNQALLTTISSAQDGGRLVLYAPDGARLAAGQGFERGGRWRHQIAAAGFGPRGEREIAAVRTPHIGGVAEFWRLDRGTLSLVAELDGYSSHAIGSRNLDMAVAGDFDGDGRPELVVPSRDRTILGAIKRTARPAGAETAWSVSLDGQLTTNLAAVEVDGVNALGAGVEDDRLRLWLPA